MADRQISYGVRDFQGIRNELLNYVKTYYPDLINDFNDASIFSVFLDLNAAVADNLHYHIDRSLQETVLQYAQQKSSIYNIAKTYGLKIPGQKPSITLCDFSITVPVSGRNADTSYMGVIERGAQVFGAGVVFETINDIDFTQDFSSQGVKNRKVIPNIINGQTVNYTIVKQEPVINGATKVFKRVITSSDVRPFLEIFLPEKNVLGITSVIAKDGQISTVPPNAEFIGDSDSKWYEVDSLAEDRIFIPDTTKNTGNAGIKVGKYIQTDNRFITEYTPEGFKKITFGNGVNTALEQLNLFTTTNQYPTIQNYLNNFSLGRTLKPNSTIFIQYRVGGGQNSNLGVNTINQIGTNVFKVNNGNEAQKTAVINSLRVNNAFPAIGGAGLPTIEEVRNFVSYNFAAQKRAVTIRDYESIIRNMPSEFGSPAKVSVQEVDNKIEVLVLSFDSNGRLTNTISNILTNNIANYLSNYRMINDYIVVKSATIIDVSVDCSVIIAANFNSNDIINSIISTINLYFSPQSMQLGTDVNLSEIKSNIQKLNGVFTVSDLTIINEVGGNYSGGFTSMEYSNTTTKTIKPIDEMIYVQPSEVYHIRYPDIDIRVKVKTSGNVTIG
jgi:hypothetical protein